jgi:hypothetical protein
VGAARVDVESNARERVDSALEVRDGDHDVVDAGQHVGPSERCMLHRLLAFRRATPAFRKS